MSIKFIVNKVDSLKVHRTISNSLSWAEECYFAVAYAKAPAFKLLHESIKKFLNKGGKLRSIFDIEMVSTDIEWILQMATTPGDSECKVFYRYPSKDLGRKKIGIFHPKLYIFIKGDKQRVLIGSSNLTRGGIDANYETNILLEGKKNSLPFKDIYNYFSSDLWDDWTCVPVIGNEKLIEEYEKLLKVVRKGQKKQAKEQQKIRKNLADLINISNEEKTQDLNDDIAYIFGLACAKGKVEISRRCLTIEYAKKKLKGGYIQAKGISKIHIKQDVAIQRNVDNIQEKISRLFKKYSKNDRITTEKKGELKHEITLVFSKKSPYWKTLLSFFNEKQIEGGRIPPYIPNKIQNAKLNILKSFICGYFDIRLRVSPSDRYPKGPLRIALGLDTHAVDFGSALCQILQEKLKIKGVQIEWGKARGKDNMIRINPVGIENNQELVSFHWARILIHDFRNYNKEHFGNIKLKYFDLKKSLDSKSAKISQK